MLKENLEHVKEEVRKAAEKAGRKPSAVTVIAVSKTKPEEDILALYEAGHRDFGENYVQELVKKKEDLPDDIRWHMIGHLQRNKVKYIAPFITMIHSVDSLPLAQTIEKEAAKCGRVIDVLIEVNAGGEETKFGVTPEEAPALFEAVNALPHVNACGFMTSAPPAEDPETLRPLFRKMAQLSLDTALKNHNNENGMELSMGMSNDYPVAVEEGATYVRVGTVIFGARHYDARIHE